MLGPETAARAVASSDGLRVRGEICVIGYSVGPVGVEVEQRLPGQVIACKRAYPCVERRELPGRTIAGRRRGLSPPKVHRFEPFGCPAGASPPAAAPTVPAETSTAQTRSLTRPRREGWFGVLHLPLDCRRRPGYADAQRNQNRRCRCQQQTRAPSCATCKVADCTYPRLPWQDCAAAVEVLVALSKSVVAATPTAPMRVPRLRSSIGDQRALHPREPPQSFLQLR